MYLKDGEVLYIRTSKGKWCVLCAEGLLTVDKVG